MKHITKILAIILAAAMSCMFLVSCGRSRLETEGLTGGDSVTSGNGEIAYEDDIDEQDETDNKKKADKEDKSEEKEEKEEKEENDKKDKKSTKKSSAKKYNKDYVNVTGKTVGDLAEEMGKSLDQFLADNKLPADMHEDTYETAAYYAKRVEDVAVDAGVTLEELKMIFGLEDINPDDMWGEVYDKVKLRNLVGEDGLEEYKKQFGLGDNITLDTTWGEIRNIVHEHEKNAQKNAGVTE